MAISKTSIANMALGRIGAGRINNFTDGSTESIQVALHYEQTRDSLLRSYNWQFATERKSLSENTTAPPYGWDNQFDLPSNFLKLIGVYDNDNIPLEPTLHSYAIENNKILTHADSVNVIYVKKVTDPTKFDKLFVEALVLSLAVKIIMPLARDMKGRESLVIEFNGLISGVRALSRQESNTQGRLERDEWLSKRFNNRIPSRL